MYKIFLFIIFCGLIFNLKGQKLKNLQNQREKIEKELEYIQKLLEKTEKDKTASLSKLQILNHNISTKQKLMRNIKDELKLLDNAINDGSRQLSGLEKNLDLIQKNYNQAIQYLYLRRSKENKLMFVLSSKNFNQAYRRLRYLKQYSLYAQNQAKKIIQLKKNVNRRISAIKSNQEEKNKLLIHENDESQSLLLEKNQQVSYVEKLKFQENKLKDDFQKQKELSRKLDMKIRELIALDIEKSKDKDGKIKLTASQQKLTGSFISNKGDLPWPTTSGFISFPFGTHPHPILKNIKIRNDGVDITTEKGAICKTIFDGTVSEISNIPGLNNIVMIRHGKYLTVYINLRSVVVKQGDKVKQGQKIGSVFTNNQENTTVLKFQLWKGFEKLDPSHWLKKL